MSTKVFEFLPDRSVPDPIPDEQSSSGQRIRMADLSRAIRKVFAAHRAATLYAAAGVMAIFAVPWLGLNLSKLVMAQRPWGAVDLRFRYYEVQLWFAGSPVYGEQSKAMHAVYPPASYAMLWPLMGWVDFPTARIISAVTLSAALAVLALLFLKGSGAQTRPERVFVVFMLLSMYATGFSIGHGQLTLYSVCAALAALILLDCLEGSWRDDLLVAGLMLFALVKPTISVPFFWLLLFRARSLRPMALVVLGYAGLTLLAVSYQGFELSTLMQGWLARSVEGAAREARGGYGNVHSWLLMFGLREWNTVASVLLLLALGYWTSRHRSDDLWLLVGVAAIVSRLWVYHRSYDDVLVLLPMVALFRLAKWGPARHGHDVFAGAFLALVIVLMFVPAILLIVPEWQALVKNSQSSIPLLLLPFLLYWGWHSRRDPRCAISAVPVIASN